MVTWKEQKKAIYRLALKRQLRSYGVKYRKNARTTTLEKAVRVNSMRRKR
jgi:hypothetical protein